MASLKNVLIVGGGIAGMCSAIELRKRNIEVDLIEVDPEWRVYGAGLTISGPSLRALRTIGVLGEVMRQGATWSGLDMCDAQGSVLAQFQLPSAVGAEDLPPTGAIMRPVFARILAQATKESGTRVRLGLTFSGLKQDERGVNVTFNDGTSGRYDLVIAADGLHSSVRTNVFPNAPKPRYTGQGSWRAVVPRTVDRARMCIGEHTKVGTNPVSDTEMYLYCLETRSVNTFVPADQWAALLADLLEEFGGPIGDIRRSLRDGALDRSSIVYRPLEGILMPAPWHSGRVVLIGDSAHATTPHLAMGAGLAIEDAVVLANELDGDGPIEACLNRFFQRRVERARLVVENSLRLGEIEQAGGGRDEHAQLMRTSLGAVAEPI